MCAWMWWAGVPGIGGQTRRRAPAPAGPSRACQKRHLGSQRRVRLSPQTLLLMKDLPLTGTEPITTSVEHRCGIAVLAVMGRYERINPRDGAKIIASLKKAARNFGR